MRARRWRRARARVRRGCTLADGRLAAALARAAPVCRAHRARRRRSAVRHRRQPRRARRAVAAGSPPRRRRRVRRLSSTVGASLVVARTRACIIATRERKVPATWYAATPRARSRITLRAAASPALYTSARSSACCSSSATSGVPSNGLGHLGLPRATVQWSRRSGRPNDPITREPPDSQQTRGGPGGRVVCAAVCCNTRQAKSPTRRLLRKSHLGRPAAATLSRPRSVATSMRSTSSRGRLRRPGGGLLLLARGRG